MVIFEKDKFVVEIPTGSDPIEVWLKTCDELLKLLSTADSDYVSDKNYVNVILLLKELLPDIQTARKMME